MISINRTFGKLTTKGVGHTVEITTLLNEYETADKTLGQVDCPAVLSTWQLTDRIGQIIETSKQWRDSWMAILMAQLGMAMSLDELYQPITPECAEGEEYNGPDPVVTPRLQLARASKLLGVYSDVRTDLMEEVNMIDARLITPAMNAREYVQMARKPIKRRENRRLDLERALERVNHATKKATRTDRENQVLARLEVELSQAQDVWP